MLFSLITTNPLERQMEDRLPYQPVPQRLYGPSDLLNGFELGNPDSVAHTTDFEIYRYFVMNGRSEPRSNFAAMMEALHDSFIGRERDNFLRTARRRIGFMGGHKLSRDSSVYREVFGMARELARQDCLIISGGGPGAMEASHLGAALSNSSDDEIKEAFELLAEQPSLPSDLAAIVADDGTINSELVHKLHTWWSPAISISATLKQVPTSLAIPTWHYGHEPFTPFATHVAKYFQNSIREDGILAVAIHGIVFAEGKAGTIQEIFQDAAQNYYKTFKRFSPMVFLGSDYWTVQYPVIQVLKGLFGEPDFNTYVLVTDSAADAIKFLLSFPESLITDVA
jgi:predicted Rossmann-fold nucleotide-binding protein